MELNYNLTKEDMTFLKKIKRLKDPSEEQLINIIFLYKKLINDPILIKEYETCGCPGVIRDMHFELLMFYAKNKELLQ